MKIDQTIPGHRAEEPHGDRRGGWADVTVAIVFYDGAEDLVECVRCLERQTLRPRRILVVDNSEAGLNGRVAEPETGVEILRDGRNLGFAAGNNRALREARSDFFVTLNADAFPEPDWMETMVAAAGRHPEAAAFGGLQRVHETPELADGVGDHYHFSGLAWRGGYLCEVADLDLTPRRIFSPCGAAAFFRTADLVAIGGFDEDFFCYCEDLDVGFRLWLAGRECLLVPEAVVRHRGAGSTGDSHSDFAVYHGHRNLVWVYLKNMPGIFLWLFLPFHLLLNWQMVHAVELRGQGEVIRRAKRDALRAIPRVWDKRLATQARRKATLREIWSVLDRSVPPEPWKRSFERLREQIRRRVAGRERPAKKL